MEKDKEKVAASLTVHGIPDTTPEGLSDICKWLRKLERDIRKTPEAYSKTFRARYYYRATALEE
jgi:SPX domain protein involved in polyphosphate accumulation